MKKYIIFVCIISLMIFTTSAIAAGKIDQVNQNIDISNSTIVTEPGSIGAGGSLNVFGVPVIKGGKQAGEISIGKISNKSTMKSVNQTIKSSSTKIIGTGVPINIGNM